MAIQAVFFDMHGTIQTFRHSRELHLKAMPALQSLLRSSGIDLHFTDKRLEEVVASGLARYDRWAKQTLNEIPAAQVWTDYILAGYPLEKQRMAAAAEELMLFVDTLCYQRELIPEAPAVLQALQDMGLKLGILCNAHSRHQVPCDLEGYGLRQIFDPIVLSCEYGRRKPDPALFHYAARLANVPTGDCVFVGDRFGGDILGARKAGYRLAIQIGDPIHPAEADRSPRPDACIHQVTGLIDLLRGELDHPLQERSAQGCRPHSVRAVLFDAGDILYERPERGVKLKAFLNELSLDGQKPQPEEKKRLVDLAFTGQISQEEYREGILRLYGVSQPEHIQRGKNVLENEDHNIQTIQGVPETLAELKKQGFLLGVVTDTAAPLTIKLGWFERGGFGQVWDAVITSKELGVRKPHPQMYQAALQQLGLQPAESIFVGHSAAELEGARAVGLGTIAFNYDPAAVADYYIDRFPDLLTLPFTTQTEEELL